MAFPYLSAGFFRNPPPDFELSPFLSASLDPRTADSASGSPPCSFDDWWVEDPPLVVSLALAEEWEEPEPLLKFRTTGEIAQ